MRFSETQKLNSEEFKRLTGVKREIFAIMLKILTEAEIIKKSKGGRKSVLCLEDRLLMALEYWREYRPYFHTGASYGMGETGCLRIIRWIENTLIKHSDFSLPGLKDLLKEEGASDRSILVDATETPIQRPKKNKKIIILAKKSVIL